MPNVSIGQQLTTLSNLNRPALCKLWRQLFKKDPHREMRGELMLRMLAHRLQEQQFGGLGETSSRRLRQLANTFEANLKTVGPTRPAIKPGSRLVRQWKEKVHVVEVEADGYEYKGTRYESLSEIARLITGTRWSGPLFFGLHAKPSQSRQEAQ
jgi:hypothetical protein